MRRLLVEQPVDDLLRGQHQQGLDLELTRLAQDLAEDLVAGGLGGLDRAAPAAAGTGFAQHMLQRLAGALARHLDQTERGDLGDVGLGMIAGEAFFERAQHLALVLVLGHVDEVDDDDAAEIAQSQLTADGLGGLQVGLEDGLFQIAMTDEGAGVHIDRGHGLGLVDDQMTARLETDLALERLADLLLDAVEIEQRTLALVVLDATLDLGDVLGGERDGLVDHGARVDADALDLGRHQIAQGAQRQGQIVVDQTDLVDVGAPLLDAAPELGQKGHVLLQRLFAHGLGGGAGDETALALMGLDIAQQDLAQTAALVLVLDLLRHARGRHRRHAHQIARGDRDVGGQTRPLGAERVFDHLDHDHVALAHQLVDLVAARLAGGADDVGGVQKGRALQTDVDEGRLHPRQHAADASLVDVADQTAALGALDDDLLHHPVLDDRDARLGRGDIDENLFTHSVRPSIAGF